jgi:hypothetical protein
MPFTLEQAEALMPEVRRLTAQAARDVEALMAAVDQLAAQDPRRDALGDRIHEVVEAWAREVLALGAEVKGLWLVDFDSGDGYWCWRHPEESLDYYHGYQEGFGGRRLIRPVVLH